MVLSQSLSMMKPCIGQRNSYVFERPNPLPLRVESQTVEGTADEEKAKVKVLLY
jgi:hypothetical protein